MWDVAIGGISYAMRGVIGMVGVYCHVVYTLFVYGDEARKFTRPEYYRSRARSNLNDGML